MRSTMRSEQVNKIRKTISVNYRRSKFGLYRLLTPWTSLRQYIGEGIPIFHRQIIYISTYLHSHSYLRLPLSAPPNPSSSTSLSPSISQNTKFLFRFAYPWGHRLFFNLYLAETEMHWRNNDIKERISNATVRDQYPTYAIFPTLLTSHYRLPLINEGRVVFDN
jgi:hypothetical protein